MKFASTGSMVALVASLGAFAGVVALKAVPAMRVAEDRMAQAGALMTQAGAIDGLRRERDAAEAALASLDLRADAVLRTIPANPDQAHLMRMLALGAGEDVGTQTIVAGEPLPATPAGNPGLKAVPITVEMQSSFARVMELLVRAERDRRLVRPIEIEITRAVDEKSDAPLLEARIELDAVYGVAGGPSAEGVEP